MSATRSAGVRAAAAEALLAVQRGRSMREALAHRHDLPAGDRAQFMALAYGACRFAPRHQRILARLLDRPLRGRDAVLGALLGIALYELEAGETPDYAVVDASVEASRLLGRGRASGLVNGLLRRFLRERSELLAELEHDPVCRYAHPGWLIEAIRSDWPEDWRRILEANNVHPPLWLRVNPRRSSTADYCARLQSAGFDATPLELAPQALKLARPLDVEALPGFADGLVSVQDAGAQLAAPLLDATAGQRVLDACAAPGGKSAHLLELHEGLLLLALDVDAERLERARENYARLGLAADCRVADALRPQAWWDGRPFDRILLDVPCSASGVIRRHPDIKLLRRASDIAALTLVQAALLEALWPLLAPGGALLYASCSILERENERLVQDFLDRHPEASVRLKSANLERPEWRRPDRPGLQILPGDLDMDGFYYACLDKRS